MAGVHGLIRGLSCNITFAPDLSHACHRDIHVCLKSANLFRYWLVLMIGMNLLHGPHADDMRFEQLRQSLKELFSNFQRDEVPLFQQRGADICEELIGPQEAIPEAEKLEVAWQRASELNLLDKKGY